MVPTFCRMSILSRGAQSPNRKRNGEKVGANCWGTGGPNWTGSKPSRALETRVGWLPSARVEVVNDLRLLADRIRFSSARSQGFPRVGPDSFFFRILQSCLFRPLLYSSLQSFLLKLILKLPSSKRKCEPYMEPALRSEPFLLEPALRNMLTKEPYKELKPEYAPDP